MSDSDFKYLSKGFSGGQLKLVKQKGLYPYKHIDSLESFLKINYLISVNFIVP